VCAVFNIQQEEDSFLQQIVLKLKEKKLSNCHIWSVALYGAETLTLGKVDQKYLESFEMWCCKGMEKISWIDHANSKEVLRRVKEEMNILHTIEIRKANWICHILHRNCLLKHERQRERW
jgi:elongation factor P--beta-lysine ligase